MAATGEKDIHADIINQPTKHLDSLLGKYDPLEVVSFFANATELERSKFADRAMAWFRVSFLAMRMKGAPWAFTDRELERLPRLKKDFDEVQELRKELPKEAFDEKALESAKVATLSCCKLTDLRRLGAHGLPLPDNCWLVLEKRKPKWVGSWLEFACTHRPFPYWEITRKMEVAGLAIVERDSAYWRGMAMTLAEPMKSIIETLKADSEMLENHIWCLLADDSTMLILSFPSENDTSQRIAAINNAVNIQDHLEQVRLRLELASRAWRQTLIDLASNNVIDKERFMEVILAWIMRVGSDETGRRATAGRLMRSEWFTSIFDAFDLDAVERRALLPKLIATLSVSDPKILHWSLTRVSTYSYEDIPMQDFVVNLKSLMRIKGKEHAILAIQLVEKLCDASPENRNLLANGLLSGLEHPSKEVQRRIIDFIEEHKLTADESVEAQLQFSVDGLNGLIRDRVEQLLAKSQTKLSNSKASNYQESNASLQSWSDSIAIHSKEVCDAAGLQDALNALELCESSQVSVPFAPALKLDFNSVPRLDPKKAVHPINGIDDLKYRLLHILASKWNWEEFELCLDGLMRFASSTPEDLQEQLAPLRIAAVNTLAPNGWERSTPFRSVTSTVNLAALIIAWTDRVVLEPELVEETTYAGNVVKTPHKHLAAKYETPWGSWKTYGDTLIGGTPASFVCKRLIEIAGRVARKSTLPALAAPTHQGGWIDPETLVSRLTEWENQNEVPDNCNFIQSLLRLAPDGRRRALSKAADLRGEYGDVVRFALGAPCAITETPKGSWLDTLKSAFVRDLKTERQPKAAWWVAAARARAPLQDFDNLTAIFPGLGPDSTIGARYDIEIKHLQKNNVRNYLYNLFEVTPEFKRRKGIFEFPTELFHRNRYLWNETDPTEHGIWLQSRESYFASTAAYQARNLGSTSQFWHDVWEPIFDPDVSAVGFATWNIAIGLSSPNQENARLALDALIACIEESRLDGIIFGDILGRLLSTGEISVNRWIKAFKECARVSPLHLQVTRLALERALTPNQSTPEKPHIPLLELFFDLCAASSESVGPEALREFLSSLGSKGKSGKFASSLLAFESNRAQSHRQAAATQVLQSRLQRAERYTRILKHGLDK